MQTALTFCMRITRYVFGNPYEARCHVSVHTGHFCILSEEPVNTVAEGAFFTCINIIAVILPDSVQSLGNDSFSFNIKNGQPCCIQSGVREIGYSAFSSCSSLITVIIENGSEKIGEVAFSCCDNLKVLQPPQSLKGIGLNTFYRCTVLEAVRLPDELTRIRSGAFQGCSQLKSLSIG